MLIHAIGDKNFCDEKTFMLKKNTNDNKIQIRLIIYEATENMNELEKIGERTYYLTGPFQVGVYVLDDEVSYKKNDNNDWAGYKKVCLIDSGLDKVVAKILDKLLAENKFAVELIINTHYHADHCGGNKYFQDKYGCRIVSSKVNAALISNYDICPSIIWGGPPIKEIINNYFYAESTDADDITEINLPDGFEITDLPGHCISMLCVKTPDDIMFLGDAVVGKKTLEVNHISYIYEIEPYLESLHKLKKKKASLYVPYHAKPVKDIKKLVDINLENVKNNIELIKKICYTPKTLDEIAAAYFSMHDLKLSMYKYAVEGCELRTYVSYLHNIGELVSINDNNYIKWGLKNN